MKPIYTADLETDPFKYDRKPQPFCGGIYTGDKYYDTWHTAGGDKLITQFAAILYDLPCGTVFMHNGGKFDLYYMLKLIAKDEDIMFINGRIVKCLIPCKYGMHEFRDSYAIMPFALETYKKTEIDYSKFERPVRAKHKSEILSYLKDDCVDLHKLCTEFVNRFGLQLTVGGTAMREIRKLHDFDRLTADEDHSIRSRFYYGGRVQAFEKGILTPAKGRKFQVYDINQSYPNAMKNYMHPTSAPYAVGCTVSDETFFLTVTGESKGCFPVRSKTGIDFPKGYSEFHVTIHEYNTAMELGLFALDEVIETVDFRTWATFDKFVDKFHGLRKTAQTTGDDIGALLYKYVGNSGYGKFAQRLDGYSKFRLTDDKANLESQGYTRTELIEFAGMILWEIPSDDGTAYNVATGASITGAARAVLMRGIATSKRPIYCDTDSIICESNSKIEIDSKKIGAWKLEKDGTKIAIAGKKMYALYDGRKVVKLASKGVRITGKQMCDAAMGKTVTYYKDAPTFNMKHGTTRFLKRRVKMT